MISIKEKLLNSTYEKYIQTSLADLPLKDIHNFIDEKFTGYGTALNEKLLSISDYRELVERQRDQGKNINFEFTSKPITRKIIADGNSALYVDEIIVKTYVDNESNEMLLRLSTVLEYRDEKWIVIHFHGSKPEYSGGENDPWHVNQWKQKNAELELLVEEKTADLLNKNRELEIEASLERVRARTIAMHQSSELSEAGNLLLQQMKQLGINAESCWFWFIDQNTDTIEIWTTHENKLAENIKVKASDYVTFKREVEAWKNNEPFLKLTIPKLEAIKIIRKIFDIELRNNEDADKFHLLQTRHKYGFIGIGTWLEATKEEIKILSRFANVFEQTYTRFLDLQKAETQAREAQIEAGLERIRAKAMSMQNSDDLGSIVNIIFTELKNIGFQTIRCGIGIIESALTKKVDIWSTSMTDDNLSIDFSGDEHLEGHPLLDGIIKNWIAQKEFSYTLEGRDLDKYYNVVAKTNFHLPNTNLIKKNKSKLKHYYYYVPLKAGGLYAFSNSAFTDDVINLMKRFGEVFQMSYTRYEDLKKAEEQNKIIQAENDRKTKELEEARELQMSMLPKVLPKLPNLDIAVYMQTATEVGGDYYDFNIGSNGTLTSVIGDATGHGMKAGTMVTIAKSLFNSLAKEESILKIFSEYSLVINDMKFRHLSMCLIMLKFVGNKIRFASAAMPPVLIYRKAKKKVEEKLLPGMPLGAMKNFPYKESTFKLNKGDVILLLSDGFPELHNGKNELFGYRRVKKSFKEAGERSPKKIIKHLKETASNWSGGKDPDDDVTFVVLKMK